MPRQPLKQAFSQRYVNTDNFEKTTAQFMSDNENETILVRAYHSVSIIILYVYQYTFNYYNRHIISSVSRVYSLYIQASSETSITQQ